MTKKGQDLSKQLYKFQEGITAIALELCGIPKNQVHWPTSGRPEGLTVDVDVLVGSSPEKAYANISIKHLVSGKEAEKGGWRMMREIIDSKSNCTSKVSIFNVVFDNQLKSAWETILAAFFDDLVLLEKEMPYGPVLVAKAYEYCTGPLSGLGDAKVRDLLRTAVTDKKSRSYDSALAVATRSYGMRLQKMLRKSSSGLDTFWKQVGTSCSREIPPVAIKTTCLKRGLAKLAIFEPRHRAKIYEHLLKHTPLRDLPLYALHLKLAQEGAEEDWEIIDDDILGMFRLLKDCDLPSLSGQSVDVAQLCEFIFAQSPIARMEALYIGPLRATNDIKVYFEHVEDNFGTLSDPSLLHSEMFKCFEDPSSLVNDEKLDFEDATVWLYKIIVAILKARGGTLQSSGYSSLAGKAGVSDGVDAGYIALADFVNRKPTLKLTSEVRSMVKAICGAMAVELRNIGIDAVKLLKTQTTESYRQRIMETQLIPYREFDPIGIILKRELSHVGLKWFHHSSHTTCAKEFAETSAGGTTKALEVLTQTPCLVLWQSPNKNARDKAKEFAARAACLVSKYDPKRKEFVKRGVRVFMVIDGIWDSEDVRALLGFGCEGVFYPDQITELLEVIQPGCTSRGKPRHITLAETHDEDLARAAEDNTLPKLTKRRKSNGR